MKYILIFSLVLILVQGQNKTKKLEVQLIDGSVIFGSIEKDSFNVEYEKNNIEIKVELIVTMTIKKDERVTFLFQNGDKLDAKLLIKNVQLQTVLGKLDIPKIKIKRLTVINHSTIQNFIITGKAKGASTATEFVKDLPEGLAKKYKRITKTANTVGSVASRHTSSPWLYFVRGEGESPKIFTKDGLTYYPIWGTWKLKGSRKWKTLDHNGSHLSGVTARIYPGYSTQVDYYIVPTRK